MQKRAQFISWYDTPAMRDFIVKTHNPNFSTHHLSLPLRAILVGSSGSGKTQTLLNLIFNMPNTFERIDIVVKCKDEPLYNFLAATFQGNDNFNIHEGISGLPDLDSFDKKKNSLVVLDDLVGEKAQLQKRIEEFYIRARKKNCSLIYISQSYYAVPKMIRNNLTYLFIKQVSSLKNLAMIAREYSLGLDNKLLKRVYEDATADKTSFLLIDVNDLSQKFRKGLSEVYRIDETTGEIALEDL